MIVLNLPPVDYKNKNRINISFTILQMLVILKLFFLPTIKHTTRPIISKNIESFSTYSAILNDICKKKLNETERD